MGDREDAQLVMRAQSGSDAAFAQLVDRHGAAVRTFLRRVCIDASEADDLAQIAFLTAWSSLRTLRSPERFRSWVMGIAWRKAKSAARTAGRRRAREAEWHEHQHQHQESAPQPPAAEKAIALRQAMAQLAPEPRAALALCLGAGLSHSEAAKTLGLPLGTVKSHITRGRSQLATLLGVDDE